MFGTVFTTAAQAAFVWVCIGTAIIAMELGRILFYVNILLLNLWKACIGKIQTDKKTLKNR